MGDKWCERCSEDGGVLCSLKILAHNHKKFWYNTQRTPRWVDNRPLSFGNAVQGSDRKVWGPCLFRDVVMMKKRTIVYIDGFNLYYGLWRFTSYKWLDIVAFAKSLLPHPEKHEIVAVLRKI